MSLFVFASTILGITESAVLNHSLKDLVELSLFHVPGQPALIITDGEVQRTKDKYLKEVCINLCQEGGAL